MSVVSRSFRINWRGGVFLALTFAVGYASIHKGNNLLFIVFSALAGVFVTSLLLTLLVGRRLEISRVLPDSVHANETFSYTIRIKNAKRVLPAFCVRIEDRVSYDGRPAPVPPMPVHVPIAAPRERVRATSFATAYQRGWARFSHVTVTAEFPPGLVTYRQTLAIEDQMLVYPREGILERRVLNPYLSRVEFLDLVASATTRGSEDFAGVREYRHGDNPRWIHWRLSARTPGRLLMREFEDTRVRDAVILLETFHPNPADVRRGSRLERAISFSAALAEALLADNYLVRFRAFAPDAMELALEPRKGAIADLQYALATLRPSRTHSVADLARDHDPSRDEVYFLLRIGDDDLSLPVAPERVVTIHADDMRSMMYYAS
jgi:uncharacterized protein (DUF58 family)